jgi:glutaredoxin 3
VNQSPKTDVTIYTTRVCAYCVAAKRLMNARGIAYDEIDVTADNAKRVWLAEKTGRKTVPQIFISGAAVGGYDELAALDKSGRLAEMLAPRSGATPS